MEYIDQTYFATYTTTVISAGEFAVLAERASDVIDMLTMQKIIAYGGIEEFDEATQAAIKKATAAEVETLFNQGGINAVVGNADSRASSFTVGKFSISGGGAGMATINGIPVSPLINGYLLMTGLLYRGMC
jgi:hypothetical protein